MTEHQTALSEDKADELTGEPFAQEQHNEGPCQREQRDQPNRFQEIHGATISSG